MQFTGNKVNPAIKQKLFEIEQVVEQMKGLNSIVEQLSEEISGLGSQYHRKYVFANLNIDDLDSVKSKVVAEKLLNQADLLIETATTYADAYGFDLKYESVDGSLSVYLPNRTEWNDSGWNSSSDFC